MIRDVKCGAMLILAVLAMDVAPLFARAAICFIAKECVVGSADAPHMAWPDDHGVPMELPGWSGD